MDRTKFQHLINIMCIRSIVYITKRYGHSSDGCYKFQEKKTKVPFSEEQQELGEADATNPKY